MSDPLTVSACLIVRDEAGILPECLDAVRPVVDEIVVADTGSTDRTPEVARAAGARVFEVPWEDDFSRARNAALERARGDWILVVDADERLDGVDRDAFRAPLAERERWAYLLTLVNRHEERTSEVLILRLFRNHPAVRYSGIIHERLDPALTRLGVDPARDVGRHPARIIHTGYLPWRRAEKGKDERDMQLLQKQIAAEPSDPFFRYKFAVHPHARLHQPRAAEESLEKAWILLKVQDPAGVRFSFTPEVAALYILSALGRRDPGAAARVAEQAARFPFSSPNLDYALGRSALAAGNLTAAAQHLERALACGDEVMAYAPFEGIKGFLTLNALSEVRYLQGSREEARRLHREASRTAPGGRANTFFGPPQEMVERGDPGWAMTLLLEAARSSPGDAYPWKRGGEILLALGLHERGIQWLETALDRAPDDGTIRDLLEKARREGQPA